jgi:hypothetical protein
MEFPKEMTLEDLVGVVYEGVQDDDMELVNATRSELRKRGLFGPDLDRAYQAYAKKATEQIVEIVENDPVDVMEDDDAETILGINADGHLCGSDGVALGEDG